MQMKNNTNQSVTLIIDNDATQVFNDNDDDAANTITTTTTTTPGNRSTTVVEGGGDTSTTNSDDDRNAKIIALRKALADAKAQVEREKQNYINSLLHRKKNLAKV